MARRRRRRGGEAPPDGPALWVEERRFQYPPYIALAPQVHGVAEDEPDDGTRQRYPDRPRWLLDGFRHAVRRLWSELSRPESRRR